jgi:ATP-binding cassette, subfamily B, bacterial
MADEKELTWQEELRANLRVIGLSLRASPLFASVTLLGTALEGIVPAILVSQIGRFISVVRSASAAGRGSADYNEAVHALTVLGVAIAASQLIKPIKGAFQFGLGRKYQALLSRRVMQGVTGVPGVAHFEDPGFRDKLEVHDWIGWAPANNLNLVGQAIQQMVVAISMSVVAAHYAGWVPVLLIGVALPGGLTHFNRVKTQGLALWQDTPEVRRANYYRNLAMELESAKEIRLFGLKMFTINRQDHFWLAGFSETWRKRRSAAVQVAWLHGLTMAGTIFVYWTMLHTALYGPGPTALRAGRFASGSLAATGIVTAVIAVFTSLAWVRRMNYMLPYVIRLFDLAKTDPRMEVSGTRSAHGLPRAGIRFEGVRFRYPTTERWILDGVDLYIPPGQSIALVGENGAGKTTLIKLLCRFYDPTEGRITLDGVDIREFDLVDLRRRLACIFQDFTRYELSARDNIGFGSVERRHETDLVAEAATRVGVLEEIERLPQGWETPLAREFDGVDLSGGQWQRIALARAMMAQIGHDADVLCLDEPTASLDVRLEHELYEHFAELARGRTTLLVSHRFSTVRMAERIVFLEAGRVVEDGSHVELIARAGRYAELYHLQAQHYATTGVLE